jgi:hypothetical protein
LNEDDVRDFIDAYLPNLLPKTIEHMALATALLIRPLIHTGLPRSFATTLTKRLADIAKTN